MPHVKPKYLHPQHGTGYHGAFLGVAAEPLRENEIVIVTGLDGDRLKFSLADSDASNLRLGVMGVVDHDCATGGVVRIVSHKVVTTSIDTSGSTLGAPVYLSQTPGAHVISAPTHDVIVGNVIVLHASTGKVVLAPGRCTGAVTSQAWTA